MNKQSETGHAKNVRNFEALISIVTSFGEAYNPSREALQLPYLLALHQNGKLAVNQVKSSHSVYLVAIAAREDAFAPLNKYTTRVYNALKSSGSSATIDKSAHSLLRKIQGIRASAKKTEEEIQALAAEGKEVKQISSSQLSFDLRIENTEKFVVLLEGIPEYAPNESELSTNSMNSYLNFLNEKNQEAVSATAQLEKARNFRNNVLYAPNVGLVDIAVDVKSYVKSVFGPSSNEYKQLAGLTFKTVKIAKDTMPFFPSEPAR